VKTNVVPYELTVLKLSNYGKEMKDETERFTIEINNRKHWYFSKFEY